MRPVNINLYGPPGCGKSHKLLTFPDKNPRYPEKDGLVVFDFERRLQDLMPKFGYDEDPDTGEFVKFDPEAKNIIVLDYGMPLQWKVKQKTYGTEEWDTFMTEYELYLKTAVSVGIDTGSTLWSVDREAYRQLVKAEQLTPFMYAVPNQNMINLCQMARDAKVNLIFTHHTRDVYVNDRPTGEKESDGFSHLHDKMDWVVGMDLKREKDKGQTVVKTESTILKCSFDRSLVWQTFDDLDYTKLAALVDA